VNGFYDRYGESWLSSGREGLEQLAAAYKASTMCSLLGDLAPKTIIDFGCGLGDALALVAARLSASEALGIDVSHSMTEAARARHPECTFVRGGVEALRGRKADLVLFFDVIEHIEDIPSLLGTACACSPHIGIKVPIEHTAYTSLLTLLRLKGEGSRHRLSEGHLYEFAERDVDGIVAQSGLRAIARLVTLPPRAVLFNRFLCEELRAIGGVSGTIRATGHALIGRLPYAISKRLEAFLTGSDLFMVCERA
jgi:SAM-dependent methyltransferase